MTGENQRGSVERAKNEKQIEHNRIARLQETDEEPYIDELLD
ncbi:MAG: hypothetical protein ACI8YI_002331, partial [Paracoccaceae bacterium]